MSDRWGIDYNCDGDVSWTESQLTYNAIRAVINSNNHDSSCDYSDDYSDGYADGYSAGYSDEYSEGYSDGYADRYSSGYSHRSSSSRHKSSSESSYESSHSSSVSSCNNSGIATAAKTGKFKTYFIRFILTLASVVAVIFIIRLISDYCADLKADSDYDKAIGFITSEDYDLAIDILNNYHGSDFYYLECLAELLKLDKESDGFNDCSKFDLERFQSELEWALICKGDFMSWYIDDLKKRENEIVKRYEDYIEQPILDEIKKNPPYRLMSTKYIDKTSLGEPYKVENIMIADYEDPKEFIDSEVARTAPGKIYTFIDDGTVYYVLCSESLVIEVSINEKFEKRTTTTKKNKTSSINKTASDDKYDTSRFDHAEDFYDFYYYDFRDFYEAKDYYEEHKK